MSKNPQDYYVLNMGYDQEIESFFMQLSPKSLGGQPTDEHLEWEHPDFEQISEATYITESYRSYDDLKNWLQSQGFEFMLPKLNLSFSKPSLNSITFSSKGKKFETKELTELIVGDWRSRFLGEIFGQFENKIEYNPKNWKRGYKKKFKLADYNSALENSSCSYDLDNYYMDGSESYFCCFPYFNKSYLDNQDNVVVAREFWLKDEDAQVLVLTNSNDNEVVGILYHID